MSPELILTTVDAALPFIAGFLVTLLGFRIVGKKAGVSQRYDQWFNRYGLPLKIVGLLLMLVGAFLAANSFISGTSTHKARPEAAWPRFATSDGVCSAAFPGPPKEETRSAHGIETIRLKLVRSDGNVYYLGYSDLTDASLERTKEQKLNAVRDGIPAAMQQAGIACDFVREEDVSASGESGRHFEFRCARAGVRDKSLHSRQAGLSDRRSHCLGRKE